MQIKSSTYNGVTMTLEHDEKLGIELSGSMFLSVEGYDPKIKIAFDGFILDFEYKFSTEDAIKIISNIDKVVRGLDINTNSKEKLKYFAKHIQYRFMSVITERANDGRFS